MSVKNHIPSHIDFAHVCKTTGLTFHHATIVESKRGEDGKVITSEPYVQAIAKNSEGKIVASDTGGTEREAKTKLLEKIIEITGIDPTPNSAEAALSRRVAELEAKLSVVTGDAPVKKKSAKTDTVIPS
jgi:hypothetical protein